MKKLLVTSAIVSGLFFAQPVAADIFNLTVVVDGVTKDFSFSNAEDFIRTNEDKRLEALFDNYTSNSAVSSTLDFRGLPATVTIGASNSDVRLQIPSLNIDKTFSGTNRDNSVDKMVDFFQDEGGDLLNQVQKKLVAVSAEDVVAGNPNSLQSSFLDSFYNAGAPSALGFAPLRDEGDTNFLNSTDNYFLTGATVDSIDADGSTGYEVNVPFGYSFGFNNKPGYRLTVQMPLSYTKIEGASAYKVGLLTDLQIPVAKDWYLYPHFGYGAAGSEDLASLGQMIAGGLTSKYHFSLGKEDDVKLVLGNTVGYSQSLELSFGDYEFDPDISNTYTKNGLSAYIPSSTVFNTGKGDIKLGYAYAHFFGTELFLKSYHDIELGWVGDITDNTEGSITTHYTVGDDYTEVGLRFKVAY